MKNYTMEEVLRLCIRRHCDERVPRGWEPDAGGGCCVYRSQDGGMCAIGLVLADQRVDDDILYRWGERVDDWAGIILLGRRVSKTFMRYDDETCKVMGRPVVCLPHPSRLNRWWNDETNETTARLAVGAFRAFLTQD